MNASRARLAVAALLLLVVAGGLWWVAGSAPAADASVGEHRVVVVGPAGMVEHDAVVAARSTPLDLLRALAAAQGFEVEVEQQPWVGTGCTSAYVRAIAGHAETASGGWNYYTRSGGGDWRWQPAGAACHALDAGDEVEWCWVEADVCEHHAP